MEDFLIFHLDENNDSEKMEIEEFMSYVTAPLSKEKEEN